MNLFGFLTPKPTLSDQEIETGLRWNIWEGVTSTALFSITGSGIMAAYALALGATALQIGILAAIPSITQFIQIPAILLVERVRRRKLIAVITKFITQILWFPIAFIPVLIGVPSTAAITILMGIMFLRSSIAAVMGCSQNPWIRDLIPQQTMGSYFSKRQIFINIATVAFGMSGAFFIDYWRGYAAAGDVILGYTYVILFGTVLLGISSGVFMSLIPEPLMLLPPAPKQTLLQTLTIPLRDSNFRKLMRFQLFWSFALSLATPFFAVHMLQRLGLPLSWVMGLSVISQFFNILFLRVWGPFTDRFGSKAVLSVCASLYLLVIFGWIFTTMPERYFLTIPLLVILHIFAGIAGAGIGISISIIGLKLAPQNQATPYLAAASLASSIGAGLGPLIGGSLAAFFSARQLSLIFNWFDPTHSVQLPAFSMIGFDFLFGITFLFGLLSLGTLALIQEKGAVGREVVLESLVTPMRELSQPLSSVPANNPINNISFGHLRHPPVPGLDVALGVTVYQIAQMAKLATIATVRGRRVTKKLATALGDSLAGVWKGKKRVVRAHGVEIAREMARGAFHATDEKPLDVEQMTKQIVTSVIEATKQVGVKPEDAILGASQGIVEGAIETGSDLATTTRQTMEATREVAAQIGLSENGAVNKAAEGALDAAEAIGPEATEEVEKSLP